MAACTSAATMTAGARHLCSKRKRSAPSKHRHVFSAYSSVVSVGVFFIGRTFLLVWKQSRG